MNAQPEHDKEALLKERTKTRFWLNEIETKGIEYVEGYFSHDRSWCPTVAGVTKARNEAISKHHRQERRTKILGDLASALRLDKK